MKYVSKLTDNKIHFLLLNFNNRVTIKGDDEELLKKINKKFDNQFKILAFDSNNDHKAKLGEDINNINITFLKKSDYYKIF